MILHIKTISFFCLFYLIEVSASILLSVCFSLVIVMFMCCKNVNFGYRVILRIFGCFVMDSVSLFNISDKVVPDSWYGVKSVIAVLSVFIRRLLVVA